MNIQVPFQFVEGYLPTPRHRKLRYREITAETTVTIPDIRVDEAQIAFIVHESLHIKSTIYHLWNNQLWKVVPWSARAARSEGLYPVEELLAALKRPSYVAGDTKEEAEQEKHEFASRYLIIDDVVYEQTSEPRYVVMTFGLGHNHGGTSMFVEEHYNSNINKHNYFNALERDKAVAYGKQIAARRGDNESVARIGDYCSIDVLIPECVRCNPQQEHGDGDPFLNHAEAMITGSSSISDAALGLFGILHAEAKK